MGQPNNVPDEYLPKTKTEEDDYGLSLFDQTDDIGNNDDLLYETVAVAGDHKFKLKLPPDIGTLFAHRVWTGSRIMAEFLVANAETYVTGKCTVELGAGTALPSLTCLRLGSKASIITDYPDEELLQTIKETVGCNWDTCNCPHDRVAVVAHCWGSPTDNVTDTLHNVLQKQIDNKHDVTIQQTRFDLAILSECVWMHRLHDDLVKSVDQLLDKNNGTIIATYAHHIPGCEEADDAFFAKCSARGFVTVHEQTISGNYMWNEEKQITLYLRVLQRQL